MRRRAAQLSRNARRLHGHRRTGLHPPAQRPLRRQEVARARCWPSAVRCRWPSWAATSSRRSTTTCCSGRRLSSPGPSPPPSRRRRCRAGAPAALNRAGRGRVDAARRRGRPGAAQATSARRTSPCPPADRARPAALEQAAAVLDEADTVTMLVGIGARDARAEVLAMAERLQAPIVLTLKAKRGVGAREPYQVGQSGLIGNPASTAAFDGGSSVVDGRHGFSLHRLVSDRQNGDPDRCPADPDRSPGRRRARTGRTQRPTLAGLLDRVRAKFDDSTCAHARKVYESWQERQQKLDRSRPRHRPDRPDPDRSSTTPTDRIGPNCWPRRSNRQAAAGCRVHHRYRDVDGLAVPVRGDDRLAGELFGSFNLGSMANDMPQVSARKRSTETDRSSALRRRWTVLTPTCATIWRS